MNNEDIPVLNVLREQLIAGIAEHGSRRHRLPIASAIVGATAIAIVAVFLLAVQPGGHGRQVIVHAPPAAQTGRSDTTAIAGVTASNSTTTITASNSGPTPETTTTTHPSASPTTITSPTPSTTRPATGTTLTTPTTITLTVSDRNASIAVAKGTIIDVQLDANTTAIWPTEATSTNSGVLQRLSGSSTPTSSHSQFVALASGTAQLTATGGRPCPAPPPTGPPQGCVAVGIPWAATVMVK